MTHFEYFLFRCYALLEQGDAELCACKNQPKN